MNHTRILALSFSRAVALVALAVGGVTSAPGRAAEAPRMNPPNVLVILIDDLRPLLGSYGDELARTPNIDRLARRGVRFDSAHCTYPICGPSRASILSGRRPLSTNYYGWESAPGVLQMPEWFRQYGYWTGAYGKVYHMNRLAAPRLGEKNLNVIGTTVQPPGAWDVSDPCVTPDDPDGYGYSYSATLRDEDPALERYVTARGDVSPKNLAGAWTWQEWVETNLPDAATSDGVVARHAAAAMAQAAGSGRPFFVAAGMRRPHGTLVAPKRYFDLYHGIKMPERRDGAPEHLQRIPDLALTFPKEFAYQVYSTEDIQRFESAYRANIAFVDAQVGELMRTLDEHKLWDNTIIVLTSDHGWHLGEHGGLTQKHTLFEESTRVPLLVVVPGTAAQGRGSTHPVELVDLFPTLTDLCGLPTPETLDGLSLRPLLRQPTARLARPGAISMVRRNLTPDGQPEFDSTLKVWGKGAETGKPTRLVLGISLRTEGWRYTEWDGGKLGVELYDETADPRELKNLADDPAHAAKRAELRQQLARTVAPKAP